jgi:hypothetical protein
MYPSVPLNCPSMRRMRSPVSSRVRSVANRLSAANGRFVAHKAVHEKRSRRLPRPGERVSCSPEQPHTLRPGPPPALAPCPRLRSRPRLVLPLDRPRVRSRSPRQGPAAARQRRFAARFCAIIVSSATSPSPSAAHCQFRCRRRQPRQSADRARAATCSPGSRDLLQKRLSDTASTERE